MAYRIKWTSKLTGNVSYSGVKDDLSSAEVAVRYSDAEYPYMLGEIEEVSPDHIEPDAGYVQDMLSTLSEDELAGLIERFGLKGGEP